MRSSPTNRLSRAAASLRAAPVAPCPHCGRDTKTTSDGFCAECWGAKAPDALLSPRRTRTEPLLSLDFHEPADVLLVIASVAIVTAVVAKWIWG